MSVHRIKLPFLLPLLFWFQTALAQQVVELNLSSRQSGFTIRTLASNGNVPRQHRGPMLFCDRVTSHSSGHRLSAYGHVLLVQGDSITIKSDSLSYDSNGQQATLYGHVMFQDRRTILTTEKLVYSLSMGVAQYMNRARIVDNRTVVTSQQGTYDVQLKQFTFRKNVRLANGQKSMVADSLRYTTTSQLAVRLIPTPPVSQTGVLVAQQDVRPSADKLAKSSFENTAEPAHSTTARDTLIAKNLIASVPHKLVEKSTNAILVTQPTGEPSTRKQHIKYASVDAPTPKPIVTTSVLVDTEKTPVLDSIRTQPTLYRASVQNAVATSVQFSKKSQESPVIRSVTSKPIAKASIIRTATGIAAPQSTDSIQESDLERELNKKRRFN